MSSSTAFPRLALAAGCCTVGDGLRLVALPLLAATITRNPVLISGLVAAAYLPYVLFGLPIGAMVDRGRPEVFLRMANVARAVLLTCLVVLLSADVQSIGLLCLLAFVLGTAEAVYDNATQSLVPRIVVNDRFEMANGTLVTLELVGEDLVGPALAGLLFAVSMVLPFGLSAGLLALSVLVLLRITTAAQPRPATSAGLGAEMMAGLRWLWAARFVRRLLLTGAVLTGATMAWEATLVLLALGPMGVSPASYGLILAGGAVGGVLGALCTPALVGRHDRWLLQLIALTAGGMVDLALAAFPRPWVAALAWGVTGFVFAVWIVLSASARQRLIPPALLARVNSAGRMLLMAAIPLGALTGGVLAQAFGLRAPALVSGAALLVLALVLRAGQPTGSSSVADQRPAGAWRSARVSCQRALVSQRCHSC